MEELKNARRVVGVKQVRRTLTAREAKRLFVARDADPSLTGPLAELAREQGLSVEEVPTMKALGQACGIAVGAACAAISI